MHFDTGAAYVFRLFEHDGDDVPTVSVIGSVLLMLSILAMGVYFGRRRSTS